MSGQDDSDRATQGPPRGINGRSGWKRGPEERNERGAEQ
jgi:hypothetical protein